MTLMNFPVRFGLAVAVCMIAAAAANAQTPKKKGVVPVEKDVRAYEGEWEFWFDGNNSADYTIVYNGKFTKGSQYSGLTFHLTPSGATELKIDDEDNGMHATIRLQNGQLVWRCDGEKSDITTCKVDKQEVLVLAPSMYLVRLNNKKAPKPAVPAIPSVPVTSYHKQTIYFQTALHHSRRDTTHIQVRRGNFEDRAVSSNVASHVRVVHDTECLPVSTTGYFGEVFYKPYLRFDTDRYHLISAESAQNGSLFHKMISSDLKFLNGLTGQEMFQEIEKRQLICSPIDSPGAASTTYTISYCTERNRYRGASKNALMVKPPVQGVRLPSQLLCAFEIRIDHESRPSTGITSVSVTPIFGDGRRHETSKFAGSQLSRFGVSVRHPFAANGVTHWLTIKSQGDSSLYLRISG